MADAFQPRFVDLVRNYSITQGTGAFVLGPAVQGFSSFASALQPGDQFYYSAIGVDKPNEREVGRGTLQSDGTISRSPISGAPTGFTGGSKTIALIAAAEWFTMVQAGGSGGAALCASRAAVASAETNRPAVLGEPGREGTFLFDPANRSALVGADGAQGLAIAPSSDPSGASGAWVRQFNGAAQSTWWGLSPANSAAVNRSAMIAALATLNALKVSGHGYSQGSIGLHTPAGYYAIDNSSGPVTVGHALILSGDYVGGYSGGGTWFAFNTSANDGFLVDKAAGGSSAAGATFEGLAIVGAGLVGGAIADAHGIRAHNAIQCERLFFDQWAGDAIHVTADVASGAGNANSCYFNRVAAQNCGWTIYVQGGDTNACSGYFIEAVQNRFGSVFDNSFLGNSWYGGLAETCGSNPGFVTRCEKSGHIYVVGYGQEAWCAANAPTGTASSNQGWLYLYDQGANPTQPTWSAGQTWYWSAPLASGPGNDNMYALFSGFYIEGNCNPVVLSSKSRLDPGYQGVKVWTRTGASHGGYLFSQGNQLVANGDIQINGHLNTRGGTNSLGPVDSTLPVSDCTDYLESTNYYHALQARYWVAGAPTSMGSIKFHRAGLYYDTQNGGTAHNFAVGGSAVATIGATGLGYATGSGGTVAQATSKSTRVSLSKVSGKITMNAESLAASASVGFTLTNGNIAATDVVIVNVASGATANAYAVTVDAVAAGSCRISLRNVSAAALAEAVVLTFALIKAVAA